MNTQSNDKLLQKSQFEPQTQSLITTMSTVTQVRHLRQTKENEVLKLHNRINLLQAEEEKALKRIEETRAKAHHILEFKIRQEEH